MPSDFTTDDLRGWLDFVDDREEVTIITGLPVLWDEMARLIVRAQVWSVVTALVLVAFLLFASGIQLNLITAVASSIVIGVGIDYAIHFVAAIDHARSGGPGYVLRAIDRAGRPIAANALGIAIALTALLFSPLRPHHLIVIPALLPREGIEEPASDALRPLVAP